MSERAPRDAATVILLREQAGEVQVLMTQRHASLRFMGGMWVFPGGVLSEADSGNAAFATISETRSYPCERLHTLAGERLGQRECLALAIAACRETFEETGLLLVSRSDGSKCDANLFARVQAQRAAVAAQPAAFAELLLQEGLHLDIGRLMYWAHWITPSSEPRRFDTRFFAIAAPELQTATPDLNEASGLAWMSPSQLLAAARNGVMPISQPTLYNLEALAASIREHRSLRILFASEVHRTVVPVLPKMYREGTQTTIVMPWDAGYESTAGDGTLGLTYPEALVKLPSRVVVDRA